MSTTTLTGPPVSQRPARRHRAWQLLRWVALASYPLAVVAALALGTRERGWDDLAAGLHSGSVTAVRIEGSIGGADGFQHQEQGSAQVDLVWQGRWGRQVTQVDQVVGTGGATHDGSTHVVDGRVDTALRDLSPAVQTTWGDRPGSWSEMLGWRITGEWAWLVTLPWLLTLLTLVVGPDPRGATGAAWCWLMLSPVALLAVPAYLLWGARGHRGGRRLSGGWAFVIAFLVLGDVRTF